MTKVKERLSILNTCSTVSRFFSFKFRNESSVVSIETKDKLFKLVNPCITSAQGRACFSEGCLSFPGLELEVKRHNKISVSALDQDGNTLKLELEGLLAVIFQHEIDHINGVVFLNRVSFLKKLRASKQLKEIIKRTKNGMHK